MLKAIEIENFKAVGERVRVEAAPITLLFGPNSAGKSSIVHALHYAREVLNHGHGHVKRPPSGGASVDLGGFDRLVHNHDLSRQVSIRLEFSLSDQLTRSSLFGFLLAVDGGEALATFKQAESVAIEFGVVRGNVTRYEVLWNGVQLIELAPASTDARHLTVSHFNQSHSCLGPLGTTFDANPLRIAPMRNRAGRCTALPETDAFWTYDAPEDAASGMYDLLRMLTVGPLKLARGFLSEFHYLGPIRSVIPRGFETKDRANPASPPGSGLDEWISLAELCADEVRTDDTWSFLGRVNDWMANESRFDTGYEFALHVTYELDSTSPVAECLRAGTLPSDPSAAREAMDQAPMRVRVMLRDVRSGIEVEPCEVGVGVSQLVPVVVQAYVFDTGLSAVEQPELHLHPALQARIGDLFIDGIHLHENRQFLIETHSEHLMLRLLRRIRETGNGTCPAGFTLRPKDVQVVFVENDGSQLARTYVRIDETGEFIDRWPRGFFNERAEEWM